MFVELLGLSQNISFSDGVVQNYMNLKLPNGKVMQVAVDDDTSVELIALSRGITPPPQSQPSAPAPIQAPPMQSDPDAVASGYSGFSEEDGDLVFGGEATPDVVQQRLDEAASQVASASLGHEGGVEERATRMTTPTPPPAPHWTNSRRAPTVTKDDYGYPKLSGADVADPGEVSGDSDDPEEVQQV